MNKLLKEARTLLSDVLKRGVRVGIETRIESFLKRTAGNPASQRRKKAAAARKSAKAGRHRDSTASIRSVVFHRAHGWCELGCGALPTELHHLEGGSGRRALQRASNCMATCSSCHRDFHNAPESYRALVLEWAAEFNFPVPRRFRGAKMTSAASAPQAPPKALSGDES